MLINKKSILVFFLVYCHTVDVHVCLMCFPWLVIRQSLTLADSEWFWDRWLEFTYRSDQHSGSLNTLKP